MKKRNLIIATALIVFALLLAFGVIQRVGDFGLAMVFRPDGLNDQESVAIAACPTFHYLLEALEGKSGINTIKTQSTAENIEMLKNDQVDLIISGRALKADEPDFEWEIIGPGYDFIFVEEIAIMENEMVFIPFYTNLDKDKIINDFHNISDDNLTQVENLGDYLKEGIVITRLERLSEEENIVHIFKLDGSRIRLSRTPRLYYSKDLSQEKLDLIINLVREG